MLYRFLGNDFLYFYCHINTLICLVFIYYLLSTGPYPGILTVLISSIPPTTQSLLATIQRNEYRWLLIGTAILHEQFLTQIARMLIRPILNETSYTECEFFWLR